jgi:MFS transporter, CP family, cyanate transporter
MRATLGGDGATSPPGLGVALFLVALCAAAVTMRPQLTAVAPLLPRMQTDLGVPYWAVGLLVTIPVVCMGVFAPLTPIVQGALGLRRAVTLCLLTIGLAGLARAVAPGIVLVLVLTVLVGVAMGIGGALLPVAVKQSLPGRPVLGSGVYAAGMQFGAAASAFAAVPLALRAGGWRGSLALISGAMIACCALWWLLRRGARDARRQSRVPRLPWTSGTGWLLAAELALISATYHGVTAWLPAYLIEHGWDEIAAGSALAMVSVTALLSTVATPLLAERRGSRRAYLLSTSTLLTGALAGLLAAPGAGWVWVSLIGLSFGVLFLMALVLPLDVADRPEAVGAIAGLMLGAGFLFAAPAPSILGAIRDLTGTFRYSMWLLLAAGASLTALSTALSPRRLGRGMAVPHRD